MTKKELKADKRFKQRILRKQKFARIARKDGISIEEAMLSAWTGKPIRREGKSRL